MLLEMKIFGFLIPYSVYFLYAKVNSYSSPKIADRKF